MSNLEELNYAIISELRDQLEAKEQMIKELKAEIGHMIIKIDRLTDLLSMASGCIQGELKKQIEEELEDDTENI